MADLKTFTLPEADAILHRAIPLLREAVQLKKTIERTAAHCGYDLAKLGNQREQLKKHVYELAQKIEQLEILGCYVKDLDIGWLEFAGQFEGDDIYYGYRNNEPRIQHWRDIDDQVWQDIINLGELTIDSQQEEPPRARR